MHAIDQATRDRIAEAYFERLPFEPYPVQQEALLAWFTSPQGVLVSAPTGTGKTLIAEAAVYEALRLGRTAYYTTPLIALTEQKFRELQAAAAAWGFPPSEIGLVTGSRKVNPQARVLVVVAEILLNRLLHREAFDFRDVWAVIMDEFHTFNDPERGIVWEFSLQLLPRSVRTLLLSATVGNAYRFTRWLETRHERALTLVQSNERKVPLTFQWIGDRLLEEQIEDMVRGDESQRLTPALVFCFNRQQCWEVAELLMGKKIVDPPQQRRLGETLQTLDWSSGAGPKLKQILQRGVGVHHAGVMPKYRRAVERLFQERLLSVCVCTETLAAGINLPARSVILPTLVKGPPDKLKLIDATTAHQMFGRAGRPQFDTRGYVYALPHEDDVKILRWKEKYDAIPEDTRDPGLLKAKKQLKKKQPKRRDETTYWNESQFRSLVEATPAALGSRGPLPWRLLAYMLQASPEIEPIRRLVANRLLSDAQQLAAQRQLNRMLEALARGGFVELHPKAGPAADRTAAGADSGQTPPAPPARSAATSGLPPLDLGQRSRRDPPPAPRSPTAARGPSPPIEEAAQPEWQPQQARPTDRLERLMRLRSIHPLVGIFLGQHLGIASPDERMLVLESLLELPRSVGPAIHVPRRDEWPPGPLEAGRIDPQLLKLGLATAQELGAPVEDEPSPTGVGVYPLSLPEKLLRLFEHDYPEVRDARVWPCWVAGELLRFNGDFNAYITSYRLQRQEGLILRHCLRLVLLMDEFAAIPPPDIEPADWEESLAALADPLEAACQAIDPAGTLQWLDEARND